jgi:hypothetical protein
VDDHHAGELTMPKGVCDPSPDAHNVVEMDIENGACQARFLWDWDGVSVFPECAGPLFRARVRNNTANVTYYAHFIGRKGTPRTVDITPGMDETRNAAWLAQRGLDEYSDLASFTIDRNPDAPTVAVMRANLAAWRHGTTSDG